MNFFKALFGGKEEKPEDKKKAEEEKNFDVLKYDGVKAMRAHQIAYAIKCFNHALQMKEDLEINDYLSQAYMMADQMPQAYEHLQKLNEAQPDNMGILIRMANVAYMMEDYSAMSGACEKALLIDGSLPEVHYLYAKACIGQEDSVNAVAMLTKAISLKADYYDAYLLRGETLLQSNELAEADEDAAYLLDAVSDNEDILILKARIEKAKDNYEESLSYYEKVIEVNPFRVEAYRERGMMKQEKGDEAGAKDDLAKVAELSAQQGTEGGNEGIEKSVNDNYKNNDPFKVF
ncbi:MAG: hypothetical protein Q4D41_03685 [Prevotellaceae bacterium]|nr:hypothetical protein [Prevotellaceae bacterium]